MWPIRLDQHENNQLFSEWHRKSPLKKTAWKSVLWIFCIVFLEVLSDSWHVLNRQIFYIFPGEENLTFNLSKAQSSAENNCWENIKQMQTYCLYFNELQFSVGNCNIAGYLNYSSVARVILLMREGRWTGRDLKTLLSWTDQVVNKII